MHKNQSIKSRISAPTATQTNSQISLFSLFPFPIKSSKHPQLALTLPQPACRTLTASSPTVSIIGTRHRGRWKLDRKRPMFRPGPAPPRTMPRNPCRRGGAKPHGRDFVITSSAALAFTAVRPLTAGKRLCAMGVDVAWLCGTMDRPHQATGRDYLGKCAGSTALCSASLDLGTCVSGICLALFLMPSSSSTTSVATAQIPLQVVCSPPVFPPSALLRVRLPTGRTPDGTSLARDHLNIEHIICTGFYFSQFPHSVCAPNRFLGSSSAGRDDAAVTLSKPVEMLFGLRLFCRLQNTTIAPLLCC